MGLRAGLDWCGKSRPTGIRSPDRPARRLSLYRLFLFLHSYNLFSLDLDILRRPVTQFGSQITSQVTLTLIRHASLNDGDPF